mgnify:FL=1
MALVIKGSSSGQITLDVPAAAGTNTLTLPASTGTVALTSDISSFAHEILHVREEQGATTYGGGASAASTVTRVLNTVVTNEITGASLGSNQFTLPAGTYFIDASAPANEVDRHRISLYNATDTSTTLLGQSEDVDATLTQTQARLRGKFTITGSKAFEIRHFTESARSVYGLGNFTTDSNNAIYTEVIVQKV